MENKFENMDDIKSNGFVDNAGENSICAVRAALRAGGKSRRCDAAGRRMPGTARNESAGRTPCTRYGAELFHGRRNAFGRRFDRDSGPLFGA